MKIGSTGTLRPIPPTATCSPDSLTSLPSALAPALLSGAEFVDRLPCLLRRLALEEGSRAC